MSVACIFENRNPVSSVLSYRLVLNPLAAASSSKMLLSTQALLERERRVRRGDR